jgi:deoxyribodipyrimidine photolyase
MLSSLRPPGSWPSGVGVEQLEMAVVRGKHQWDVPILGRFPMSEFAAKENLRLFLTHGLPRYETDRSRADIPGSTSLLSVHLRVGTISPNQLYWETEDSTLSKAEKKTFGRRLFWRDLAYFHLSCFPQMREVSIRLHYENTQWVAGEEAKRRLDAWKWGRTGYPLVDAAMRELYRTGWMTQSVRMVVASFLTEYLRISWVEGCKWFHYTLVDADSAINAMMWQNAGRSGIDQWNFVMSPENASQDPTGSYTRQWVPEVAGLPKSVLHKPWKASKDALAQAGVVLGVTYPHRIVPNLEAERKQSIDNVLSMRRSFQDANNSSGYDLITLKNGEKTVVFTIKEYRIDKRGELLEIQSLRGNSKKKKEVSTIPTPTRIKPAPKSVHAKKNRLQNAYMLDS